MLYDMMELDKLCSSGTRMFEIARLKKTLTSTIFLVIGPLSNGRPLFVLMSLFYVQLFACMHYS